MIVSGQYLYDVNGDGASNDLHWWPVYTMDYEVGPWKMAFSMVWVHGPTFMVRLLKIIVLEDLGPSLGVNRMWIKKNDYAPQSECANCFNTCSKRALLKIIRVWPLSCFLMGFTCLSLLIKCVEDVACKSSHNNFYKKNEWFNLYMFNVIYMWHAPCVVTTLNRIFSVWLYLVLLLLYLAQHWF